MQKSCQRLIALILKETMQLLRDRRTLMMVLGLPLIELFLFGYAVVLTVYHIPTAIVDQNKTPQSRDFIQALVNSQYFDVTETLQSQNQIVDEMDAGHVKAGIVIPPDFPTKLENGNANVLILLDGSDSFSVQSGYNAASIVAQNYSIQLTTKEIKRAGAAAGSLQQAIAMPITTSIRVLYNPDLRDLWFILPAIIGMILQSIAVAVAAMTVVREREVGTLEQILATPHPTGRVDPWENDPAACLMPGHYRDHTGPWHFLVWRSFSRELLALSVVIAPIYCIEPGLGLIGFDHCKEPATGPADYPNAHDLQHASNRSHLSAQCHACDIPVHRRPNPPHLFHSHLARHCHKGCWIGLFLG